MRYEYYSNESLETKSFDARKSNTQGTSMLLGGEVTVCWFFLSSTFLLTSDRSCTEWSVYTNTVLNAAEFFKFLDLHNDCFAWSLVLDNTFIGLLEPALIVTILPHCTNSGFFTVDWKSPLLYHQLFLWAHPQTRRWWRSEKGHLPAPCTALLTASVIFFEDRTSEQLFSTALA